MYDHWNPDCHWENHEEHDEKTWKFEVECGDCRMGYVEWVNAQIEAQKEQQEDAGVIRGADLDLGARWAYWDGKDIYCPDGHEVGHVKLIDDDCGYWMLEDLYVLPEHRRLGHGAAMLQVMTELDSRPVRLIVDGYGDKSAEGDFGPLSDAQLRQWYEKFGFKVIAEDEEGRKVMEYDPQATEDF